MTLQDTFEALKYRIVVNKYGTRHYYNAAGELHREGGPAMVWLDGTEAWYANGQLHREDGPAFTWADGAKSWYANGQLHREDGPAIEQSDGGKLWYINDVEYTEEQFNALVKK